MCGFAGFLQATGVVPAYAMHEVVGRMSETLSHRGPDDDGTWAEFESGIALGHRRLSIIDLSAEGHQPMVSPSGRYVIAFNGEIYNFEQLRRSLGKEGFGWRGHSDTEVMLAAFERWGVTEALRLFNGMFAFALWDRSNRRLHLARDRAGEKPLYYGWVGDTFIFASELKALRVHPAWRGAIDRDALAGYLRLAAVPAPYSIYKGISKLPAAHALEVTLVHPRYEVEPQPYWSMRTAAEEGTAEPIAIDEPSAVGELDGLLRDAVRLRMVADVPLGVFLSGGVDSSTVVALMQAQSSQRVKSFSIGFDESAYNEAQHARAVAKHLGTDHTELYVTPQDAMDVIPHLPRIYDEPFADASQIPTILVSRMAREHVTVALTGDGGDELFCGYVRYFWGRRVWNNIRMLPRPLRRAAGSALTTFSPRTWNALLANLTRFLPSGAREITGNRIHKLAEILAVPSADILYRGLISHWERPDGIALNGHEPSTIVTDPGKQAQLDDFTLRMMYLDAMAYLPDDILVKVDRASMSVGLESRVPFLDHRVMEFAWRVPLSMKLRGQQGKWLLRQVLYRYVPPELIDRPKMGFGVPIDAWLRGPLREWAESLLSERRLRTDGYFDPAPIRAKWAEHIQGTRNWQYLLWDILMFQAWLDHERETINGSMTQREFVLSVSG